MTYEIYESWKAKLQKRGGSLFILVPKSNCEFGGYKEGDTLKVSIKKVKK